MKMFLISDDMDKKLGLRLAGIDGATANTEDELNNELEKINPDIGILIVTKNIAARYPETLKKYQSKYLPLMVTI